MSLVCKGVCKAYGSVIALQDADLSVEPGEVRALLGGNGSGKSTIAKILAGTVKPDKGTFTLHGEPYRVNSPKAAKRKKVVMTSQELSLLTNLTEAENLSICDIPRKGCFTDRREIEKRAEAMMQELEITELRDKKIDALTAGEQYMVEFAKALLADPDVLIIDEITSALYNTDVEKVRRAVLSFKEKNRIVIFISHRMAELYSICDSVTVMRNGNILETYRMNEVEPNTLLSQMTGRDILKEEIDETSGEYTHTGATLLKLDGRVLDGFRDPISLEVREGEVIGITGLEGHGQSTLLRTLFGMNGACAVELKGESTVIRNPREAVKKRFAFISGDRTREGVFGERSISDNAEVVMTQVLRDRKKIGVAELLQEFNVKYGSLKHRILSLSGGNQQKVVIARWIASKPTLVLADDPTKGVDVQARRDIHEIFVNLASHGSAVLMASSDEDELISMAQMTPTAKIIVMYEGQISAVLTGKNINKDNIAKASMSMQQKEAAQ